MPFTAETTLSELALSVPGAIQVLDAYRLDYCCGGKVSLRAACAKSQLPLPELVARLEKEEADMVARGGESDPRKATLSDLIQRVVDVHHAFTRSELDRLLPLAAKVLNRHGEKHPELAELAQQVAQLAEEMEPHMMREERVLFPYIAGLEVARAKGGITPRPMFGTVANPIRAMMMEHDAAGALLERMRALTNGFHPPEGACTSYRALYQGLDALERDLVHHVHLENNILFPRALELEHQRVEGT
jgi:regulator of cell morphogenesis and NO signaling